MWPTWIASSCSGGSTWENQKLKLWLNRLWLRIPVSKSMLLLARSRYSFFLLLKEGRFNFEYFKSFDLIINALDNEEARKYVNSICFNLGVPLIDSGTKGYEATVRIENYQFSVHDNCQGRHLVLWMPGESQRWRLPRLYDKVKTWKVSSCCHLG